MTLNKQPKREDPSQRISPIRSLNRRDFIKKTVLGGGALFLYGNLGILRVREEFNTALDEYYKKRAWNPETTRPGNSKLKSLGLSFVSEI